MKKGDSHFGLICFMLLVLVIILLNITDNVWYCLFFLTIPLLIGVEIAIEIRRREDV